LQLLTYLQTSAFSERVLTRFALAAFAVNLATGKYVDNAAFEIKLLSILFWIGVIICGLMITFFAP
jgi:formate-dependent nitrite reductase membrane component NrfD